MTERLPNSGVDFQGVPPQDRGTPKDPQIQATGRPPVPTVGRMVHFTTFDTEVERKVCRSATVTTDPDQHGQVGLCVTHPNGHEFLPAVLPHHIDETNPVWPRHTEGVAGRQPGTWHWPERV